MTTEEFNKKYDKYLKEGYCGCELENEKQLEFLDKMFQKFIQIPEFKYSQIKYKFGTYRFYCENVEFNDICFVEDCLKEIEVNERIY